jgi:GxxExxY protein
MHIDKINYITSVILDCAFRVHTELGPGLLESVYENCLFYELIQTGFKVEKQKPLPVVYKDVKLEAGYRLDLLVEDVVVIEIKSVDFIHDVHTAQVLTYLKLSKCKVGLILNFNVTKLKHGIRRYIR